MKQRFIFQNENQQKLVGILSEPVTKQHRIVIMVHGYASSKDSQTHMLLADMLYDQGINSLRFDLDGCGESDGKFEDQTISSMITDVSAAIVAMTKRGYTHIELFGSSAGGLAAMATALKHPEIKRLGLLAPVSDYPTKLLEKYGKSGIQEWRLEGFHHHITDRKKKVKVNYTFYEDCKQYIMYDQVKRIIAPVLIVHGTKDDAVKLENSKKLIEGFRDGHLIIVEGADHKLAIKGDNKDSLKLFVDWFS